MYGKDLVGGSSSSSFLVKNNLVAAAPDESLELGSHLISPRNNVEQLDLNKDIDGSEI